MRLEKERKEIVKFIKKIYQKGLVTASSKNLIVKKFLINKNPHLEKKSKLQNMEFIALKIKQMKLLKH
ncbi:MAG: hypothetical protein NZ826_06465 [Thermodesulfovibrio sp.]|nr:hypothetical protein [Thermodesulfovibrio sp.]